MLAGPVFSRELVTAPRRARFFVSRAAYVATLFVLICTAWLVLAGTQQVQNVGDLARFGGILFPILAKLQLALALFFSALFTASAVAQEKDRRTLILLLMTRMTNSQLVLGRLLASMLNVLVMLFAAAPLLMIVVLFGGVGFPQIASVLAVTLTAALAAGSLGSLIALWRDKTFQALALSVLALVLWIAAWEIVATGAFGRQWFGVSHHTWCATFSPWQAVVLAANGNFDAGSGVFAILSRVGLFVPTALLGAALLNLIAIVRVRVWNPSREVRSAGTKSEGTDTAPADTAPTATSTEAAIELHAAPGRVRPVWAQPILWREIRTWAYGRKIIAIRLVYLATFALCAVVLHRLVLDGTISDHRASTVIPAAAKALVPLLLVSLALINAMAVTSLTTERDGKAIDLLLVTDLSPKEIIFGKLGGVLYNTKEMLLLPIGLCVYLRMQDGISTENLIYLIVGVLVMGLFAATLGIHIAMTYANSRNAVAVSLGTIFFLTLGVATCMQIMISFRGSFQIQLQPFLAFMLGGGAGLYLAWGARNPSPAIGLASFGCPIATFYVITSFLERSPLAVFSVTTVTYLFTTAAMLIPALYEFDVATGRTTGSDS